MTTATSAGLRPATLFDLAAVANLLRSARLPVADLADHLGRFQLGEADGQLIMAGGYERHGTEVLLRSVVVAPAFRRQGHGQRLVRALLAEAAAGGGTRAWLLTLSAMPFFATLGFAPAARSDAPRAIRGTRQFTTHADDSATLMTSSLPLSPSPAR